MGQKMTEKAKVRALLKKMSEKEGKEYDDPKSAKASLTHLFPPPATHTHTH